MAPLLHRAAIKRPHRHQTWTVQLYSTGGANVHPIYHIFFGPTRIHTPNGISSSSAVFAQLRAQFPILYNGPPLPLKTAHLHGDLTPI